MKEIEKIEFFLKQNSINKFSINGDNSVDVFSSVLLNGLKCETLPIRFNKITGNFVCLDSGLKSMVGFPLEISGDFVCKRNKIANVLNSPRLIGGSYDCSENYIKSLKGVPDIINGDFNCSGNKLESLEFSPRIIRGSFIANNNNLTSLKGGPDLIGEDYMARHNNITSLKGITKKINRNVYLAYNDVRKLTDDLDLDLNATVELIGNENLKKWNEVVTMSEIRVFLLKNRLVKTTVVKSNINKKI